MGLMAVAAVALWGSAALAQCSKDTDCKGSRVCSAGQCVDPVPAPVYQQPQAQPLPPPPAAYQQPAPQAPAPVIYQQPAPTVVVQQPAQQMPAPPPPSAQPVVIINNQGQGGPQQPLKLQEPQLGRKKPSAGWPIAAGVMGLIFSPTVLVLAGISAATSDAVGIGFGIAALLTGIIFTPIIASGSSSARSFEGVNGVAVLRVFGWILYGLSVAAGIVEVSAALLGATDMGTLVFLTGCGGALAMLFFSIDGFVAGGQAKSLANRIDRGEASLEIAQYVSPIRMPDGKIGVGAGLVARF
jgi:hypothetical protein